MYCVDARECKCIDDNRQKKFSRLDPYKTVKQKFVNDFSPFPIIPNIQN